LSSKVQFAIGGFIGVLVLVGWALALFVAPVDAEQREVYRILYLHVPSAISAFAASLGICIASVMGMRSGKEEHLQMARAWAEVGLLFTVLTLATGSIWGKPTWGTWWEWDARLTTTLILALLYAAFLVLAQALPQGPGRLKACGVVGILIFVDVPIIYKSVTWWRTLHQPPSLLRPGGSTMAPEMRNILFYCLAVTIAFGCWLAWSRVRNLKAQAELEALSMAQLKGNRR
jgi:heme exporter protein C